MPSIADAIKATQANAAASPGGVAVAAPAPTPQNTVQSATPILDLPGGGGLPQRGMFPANLVLSGDRNDSSRIFRGPGARSAVFPFPVTPQQAATAVTATQAAVAAATLSILTGNVPNPVQGKLNFQSGNNNLIITSDANGNEIFTVAGGAGDGLVHGSTPWEIDPSSAILYEDFKFNRNLGVGTSGTDGAGENSWQMTPNLGGGNTTPVTYNAAPSHMGVLELLTNFVTNNSGVVVTPNVETTNGGPFGPQGAVNALMPLLDYPGWIYRCVFRWAYPIAAGSSPIGNAAFSLAKSATYIGMMSGLGASATNVTACGVRPCVFLGLRYDTDVPVSIPVTAVAAASGGTTVYTLSGTAPTNVNYYLGSMITFAGLAAPNNNGTFRCTAYASGGGTITVANPSGTLAMAQTGTAQAPAINDTTIKFESVGNPFSIGNSIRNNTQGQVFDTGVTPAENQWYRLDMTCLAAGVVTMTLSSDGATLANNTVTVNPLTMGTAAASAITWLTSNGYVEAAFNGADIYDGTNQTAFPFGIGSIGTITSGPPLGFSVGQKLVALGDDSVGSSNFIAQNATVITPGSQPTIITGLPALVPCFYFGTTSNSGTTTVAPIATRALDIDFVGLAYNAGLAGAAVNVGFSRYFSE